METSPKTRRLASVAATKQVRSERTLMRLLDAAEELLQERGLSGLSIPEIVRRADSSVGGFYGRFRDKNELLRALEERQFRELEVLVDRLVDSRRWSGAPAAAIVAAATTELVRAVRERKEILGAFLWRATQDVGVREEGLAFRQGATVRLRELLLSECPGEFSHPDPELAIDLAVQTAFAFMQQHIVVGETRSGDRILSDEELAHELTRMVCAYVGIKALPEMAKDRHSGKQELGGIQ
jgi:AcrR family transcriptional regulator